MTQTLIALFGLTSLIFAMGNNRRLRKWAPVVGLAGQPFWAVFAVESGGWGLVLLVLAYTLVYLNAIRLQWSPA